MLGFQRLCQHPNTLRHAAVSNPLIPLAVVHGMALAWYWVRSLDRDYKEQQVKKTYEVDTKPDAKGDSKRTIVTVDDTGATPDQVFDQAARTLIVTAQGGWRRNGSIPANATIMVKDVGTRQAFVATPDSLAAKASSMSAEERKALIAKLQALK